MLNTPSNPCGTMYTPEELRAIAKMLENHPGVYIFSDEIYDCLIYSDIKHLSLGSLSEACKSSDYDQRLVQNVCNDGLANWICVCP